MECPFCRCKGMRWHHTTLHIQPPETTSENKHYPPIRYEEPWTCPTCGFTTNFTREKELKTRPKEADDGRTGENGTQQTTHTHEDFTKQSPTQKTSKEEGRQQKGP